MSIHDQVREWEKTLPRVTPAGRPLHLKPSLQEHIDAMLKAHEITALKSLEELPDSVDLSKTLLANEQTHDQGQFGICPAEMLGYGEDLLGIENGHFPGAPGVSRTFNYKLVKNPASTCYDGDAGDAGTDLAHIFLSGTNYGYVPEALDPFSEFTSDVNCPMPSAAALAAAGDKTKTPVSVFTLTDSVTGRSTNLLAALNILAAQAGDPNAKGVGIAVVVCDNFETPVLQADGTYVAATPAGTFDGLHAILLVGYRKTAAGVQVMFINSWGPDWPASGLNGVCYMAEGWDTCQIDMTGDPNGSGLTFALMEGMTASDTVTSRPAPVPTVTGISPTTGPAAGGATVTITGSGFTGASQVLFGGVTSDSPFTVVSDTEITAITPAGDGEVDIVVIVNGAESAESTADQFTYAAAPDTSKQIIFQVGNITMMAFGKQIELDLAPMDIDIGPGGRTVLPARADAEARGDDVQWDEATKTVTITPAVTPAMLQEAKDELAAEKTAHDETKTKLTDTEAALANAKERLAGIEALADFPG